MPAGKQPNRAGDPVMLHDDKASDRGRDGCRNLNVLHRSCRKKSTEYGNLLRAQYGSDA